MKFAATNEREMLKLLQGQYVKLRDSDGGIIDHGYLYVGGFLGMVEVCRDGMRRSYDYDEFTEVVWVFAEGSREV